MIDEDVVCKYLIRINSWIFISLFRVNRRRKRSTKVEVLMKCRAKEDRSCKFDACKKKNKQKAQKKFEDTKTIDNLPCEVRTAGKITRIRISVVLVNVVVASMIRNFFFFFLFNRKIVFIQILLNHYLDLVQ